MPYYFFLFLSSSWAPPFREDIDVDPRHYVEQFKVPPDEASRLLKPHWKHGFKEKLSEMIGVSQPTLKALVEEKKANKALAKFNKLLRKKNSVFWNLFSVEIKAQVILGELIRETSLKDVAEQLEVEPESLESFQAFPSKESEILKHISQVSLENWPIEDHEEPSPTIAKIPATFDGRTIPGGMVDVSSFRAFSSREDQCEVLYGSSDRNPGYIPPDETSLREKQKRHLSQFKVIIQGLDPADPNVSPERVARQLGRMSIGESPTVGIGEIYVQSTERGKELQRHSKMPAEATRTFYTDGENPPNFVSRIGEEASESFAHSRPKFDVYNRKRWYPISSYSYVHTLPTGHIITFQRGHGCDHVDTLEHDGTLSTDDPNNFVPQNSYYNQWIRGPLVARIRSGGGSYRELSLYHHTPYTIKDEKIPEAFIFVELYDGEPESAYFFPNLVAYKFLDFEKPHKSNYLNYLDLFRINPLIEYFFNPFVQAQNPIPHIEQRNRADIISLRVPLDITILFDNMTEHAFPPRARSTLIRSIIRQNVNTAAILDFESLVSIEGAINYYGNDRIYWELDDRSEEERTVAFTTHLPELSQPIRNAFDQVKAEFPETYANQRIFRRALTQAFGHLIELVRPSDQKIIRQIIEGHSVKNIDLARRYLQLAFKRIEQGDFTDRDLRGIQHVLMDIPELENHEKLKELEALYKNPNMRRRKIDGETKGFPSPEVSPSIGSSEETRLERAFKNYALNNILNHDSAEIEAGNLNFETLFELLFIFQEYNCEHWKIRYETVCNHLMALHLFDTTLEQKKKVADCFKRPKDPDKCLIWKNKILDHFYKSLAPEPADAKLIASWIRNGIGCRPGDEKEAKEFEAKAEKQIAEHSTEN